MRFLLRFGAPLLVALTLVSIVLTPVADRLVSRWFQRDLQLRSSLIFNAIRPSLEELVRAGNRMQVRSLFDAIAKDERVLAIAWCDPGGHVAMSSRSWMADMHCPSTKTGTFFEVSERERGSILTAAFLVGEASAPLGQLVILHDLSFAESRTTAAQLYLLGFLVLVSVVAGAVTMMVARMTLRGWLRNMRGVLRGDGREDGRQHDPDLAPVMGEIRQLIRDLDISNRASPGIRADWTPDALRRVIDTELSGTQVIVVSNREPYIHNHDATGQVVLQRPASGLVTALEPVMRACGGTWIAHGSGTADRETADRRDRIAVPPKDPSYTLRRIWLSDEEQAGYYYGLANEGMWPLCHITFVRPTFREADWTHYRAVNQKFADAVVAESTRPDPLILIQDYHFALLPRMIRERLPNATIVTFWHIPWPNAEVFGICPWGEEILNGLLGSSVVGFHTQLHCNNFIESADRFIECHIDREDSAVSVAGHSTSVRPYPISIAWPPEALQSQLPVPDCRTAVFRRHGLPENTILAVGVERFDFTKGIPDRFRAIDILLERRPELRGRFVFLQVAAPTRSKLGAYQEIRREAETLAQSINAKFWSPEYKPIILEVRHYEPDEVFELFRAADICIVNSLHDGMNLVAKEFVAARDDEQGVLILSTFAGASRELMEALIVNPFDARASAEAIYRAALMSRDEQSRRMRLMRSLVSENNIFYWAGRMLLDAARLRKRAQLESSIAIAALEERLRA